MHGVIWWSELTTKDVEKAKAHYGAVAGWTFEGMDMDGYTYWLAKRDGQPVAGIWGGETIPYDVPSHWLTYIAVADIDAAMTAARETGGEVMREPFEVPGVGKIAIVSEPGGGVAGLIEPPESETPASA